MDQLQLYINDQLVDLSDDTPVALTFQINNLAEVKNQQGNTSNQFKLPLTQRNRRILGFPDDVAFCTNQPYQQYQAKLMQDGLEIIPYGIAELNGVEQGKAAITVLSGNVDFFDAIGGKLYEMGDSTSQWSSYGKSLLWKPFDHAWTLDNVAGSQQKTGDWIWPVVDYGAIDPTLFDAPINVMYQRPGFFIKTAIDILVQSAGYKATGSLLADPLYPLMIAQFSNGNFEHGTDYQNQTDVKGINVANLAATSLSHPNAKQNVATVLTWDTVNSDISGLFSGGTTFTTQQVSDVKIIITFPHVLLHGRVTDTGNSSTLSVYIRIHQPGLPDITSNPCILSFNSYGEKKPGKLGSDPNGWIRNSGDGNDIIGTIDIFKATASFQTTLPIGASVDVYTSWSGYSGSYAYIYPGASFQVQSQNQKVQFGDTVQCERIFPDIAQKDLLKDTLQRFGIICQADNPSKTIAFNSLRDIVNNIPVAKNWTSKCLDQGKQLTFQLGSYAQVNTLEYQPDDNILPATYGWSQITIADQTLPASATLFKSLFAPTLNRLYYGGTIAQIQMIDSTSDTMDFGVSVAPRILIDQKLNIAQLGKTVTFTDGSKSRVINDIISTPYFYKPDAPQPAPGYGQASLLFDDLRKQYYPELQKVLTQTKKVVLYMLLSPRDILELDLLIPVYLQQDGAYYYINKIEAWRKGQPCKVELVKLG